MNVNSQFFNDNENTLRQNTQKDDIEDAYEEEAEETSLAIWSIEDDKMFQPFGLINHGTTDSKSVFVTWSENYLLNFVFKKSKYSNQIKLTKVRLNMPKHCNNDMEESIREILILKLNTLLLMQSGRIYYFSSVKSMHPIKWLNEVRCVSMATDGFSVIRLLPAGNRLSLEVYRDVIYLAKSRESTLLQHFDITFDEHNFFSCQWNDEKYTLLSLTVQPGNIEYMQNLIGNTRELTVMQEVHFFTITGHLFALLAEASSSSSQSKTPEYDIQLLCTYATTVEFIKIIHEIKLFLVILQCGTIDIWYLSTISKAIRRIQHHTGTTFTHYDFSVPQACLYFTDEEQVAQLKFCYDIKANLCHVQESYKAIPGIVACTWVEGIQQLVCLSCNNIFYHLTFDHHPKESTLIEVQHKREDYEELHEIYELTPARMSQLQQKAQAFEELQKLPTQIHEAIEREFIKQQLIAIANKSHIYETLFQAQLEYCLQEPIGLFQEETVLIYTHSSAQLFQGVANINLFAIISLHISKNDIFKAALWQFHIDYAGRGHIMNVADDYLHKRLCIVIPLTMKMDELLPDFQIKLCAFARNENKFLAVALLIPLRITTATYSKLFSATPLIGSICNTYNITNLITQFNNKITYKRIDEGATPQKYIRYVISLPKMCHIKKIQKAFNTPTDICDNELKIYFISSKLSIACEKTSSCITIDSKDTIALYYAKMIVNYHIKEVAADIIAENDGDRNAMQQLLLQLQCDIEHCYGTQLQLDLNSDNINSHALHLQNLKRIYTKIRNECGNIWR